MKYYMLKNSMKKNEIGDTHPQCKGVPTGYSFTWLDRSTSMTKLDNKKFPDFIPDLIFELEETCLLTDVVSVNNIKSRGILCNEKVKSILLNHKLPSHQFYSADLSNKNIKHKYWWFHPLKNNIDSIDFRNSKFIECNLAGIELSKLEINSVEDFHDQYENLRRKFHTIRTNKLAFQEKQLDLIILPEVHDKILISEKLHSNLNNVTGIQVI